MLDAEIVAVDRGPPGAAGGSGPPGAAGSSAAGSAAAAGGSGGAVTAAGAGAAEGGGGAAPGSGVKLKAFQELSTRARGDITIDQVTLNPKADTLNTLERSQAQGRSRLQVVLAAHPGPC